MAVTTTTEPTTARVTAPDVPHVVAEFIAEGVLANPPVAYLVAERREGRWIIGDEVGDRRVRQDALGDELGDDVRDVGGGHPGGGGFGGGGDSHRATSRSAPRLPIARVSHERRHPLRDSAPHLR